MNFESPLPVELTSMKEHFQMTTDPIIPDYRSACLSNIVPALLEHPVIGSGWLPDEVLDARKVVLLLVDGLGYEKFKISEQKDLVPNLQK